MAHITFESDFCGRCGGTGRMPFSTAGGVCFGCGGTKKIQTRAGKASAKKFRIWRDANLATAPHAVVVGTYYRTCVKPMVGACMFVRFPKPMLVVAVEPGADPAKGVWITFRYRGTAHSWMQVDAEKQTLRLQHFASEVLYRRPTTDEIRALAPTLGKGATLHDEPVMAPLDNRV